VTEEVYEAPMLSETGDFAEVTLGWPWGNRYDGAAAVLALPLRPVSSVL
jgi:hypothetical protein